MKFLYTVSLIKGSVLKWISEHQQLITLICKALIVLLVCCAVVILLVCKALVVLISCLIILIVLVAQIIVLLVVCKIAHLSSIPFYGISLCRVIYFYSLNKNHFAAYNIHKGVSFVSRLFKNLILFAIGGIVYIVIELLWRGYTHFSMFLLGGLCFRLIGSLNDYSSRKPPLFFQMVLGAFIITALEFVCGYIVNIRLCLNVWDYSDMPLNIMGQICLPYTLLWFILSGVCVVIDDRLQENLF